IGTGGSMPICAIAGLRGLMLPGPSLTVRPRSASVLVQIIVVAFVLRLLHLRAVLPLELGHPPEVGMDRWLSMHIATAVADGRWLGGWAAPYDSSPGYAYLLAALYRICGRQWPGPLLIQIALGALVPLLVWDVGAGLVVVPMAVREQAAVRRGASSSLWGIHFYIGTNAAADGAYTPVPGVRDDIVGHIVDARAVAERRVGRVLAPSDVSWFWFR